MFASFRLAYVKSRLRSERARVFGHAEFLNEMLVHRLCSVRSYLNGLGGSCLSTLRDSIGLAGRVLSVRGSRNWTRQRQRRELFATKRRKLELLSGTRVLYRVIIRGCNKIMQKRTHDNFFGKYLLIISYAAACIDWCNLKPKLRKFANSVNQ